MIIFTSYILTFSYTKIIKLYNAIYKTYFTQFQYEINCNEISYLYLTLNTKYITIHYN